MTSIRSQGGTSAISSMEGRQLARSSSAAVAPASIESVEEALIGAHALWRRSPGEARWPFAGDGPWHLAQGEVGDVAGEYSETLIVNDAGRALQVRKVDSLAPRCPLDAAEVGTRDRVTAWLQWVGEGRADGPLDRRLVWLATARLAAGEARVPWGRLAVRLGSGLSRQALLRRYRLGLATIACRLNGWPLRRAKALLARDGLIEAPEERAAFVVGNLD